MTAKDESTQKAQLRSYRLTRREFLPLLGAATVAATAARPVAAAAAGKPRRSRTTLKPGSFTLAPTRRRASRPAELTRHSRRHLRVPDGPGRRRVDAAPGCDGLKPVVRGARSHADAPLFHQREHRGRRERLRHPGYRAAQLPQLAGVRRQLPCASERHPAGQYLFASNYGTGNYPIYPIEADGLIGAKSSDFQGEGNGTGPNPDRQEGPHAHQILTDPDASHVFGVDLGADKVNAWTLDLATGVLTPDTVPFVPVASGSGPRHMAFHPSRPLAYVLDELVSSITAFAYDPVARRAHLATDHLDIAAPLHRLQHHRRDSYPSGWAVPLQYESRSQQRRHVRDRPGHGQARRDRLGIDARGVAARDEHRPVRDVPLCGQPEHRQHRRLSHPPLERQVEVQHACPHPHAGRRRVRPTGLTFPIVGRFLLARCIRHPGKGCLIHSECP